VRLPCNSTEVLQEETSQEATHKSNEQGANEVIERRPQKVIKSFTDSYPIVILFIELVDFDIQSILGTSFDQHDTYHVTPQSLAKECVVHARIALSRHLGHHSQQVDGAQ